MFMCPSRSVLPDGISVAAYERDFGTLRWPIQAKTTTVIGMRKRAAQCPLLAQLTSQSTQLMSAFGGKADMTRTCCDVRFLTQKGHRASLNGLQLNSYDAPV